MSPRPGAKPLGAAMAVALVVTAAQHKHDTEREEPDERD